MVVLQRKNNCTVDHYWIYILRCKNGAYYTGYTTDLHRRYQEHLMGTDKCKYTRSFKPLGIAQAWQIVGNKSLAMKVEKFIKKMDRKDKEMLILNPEFLEQMFDPDKSKKYLIEKI